MTTYDRKVLRCYCCGKTSEHSILMSTNSFGSPDLDQRSAEMERDTIHTWLQECPFCGYVAFDIEKGDAKAKDFAPRHPTPHPTRWNVASWFAPPLKSTAEIDAAHF
jgi:hypothetical protein